MQGLNNAEKNSSIPTNPNHSLSTNTYAMKSHEYIKNRIQCHKLLHQIPTQPLFLKPGCVHNNKLMDQLRPVDQNMFIQKFTKKDKYVKF